MPIARKNKTPLEQAYYQFWIMREGWLVDPGTNWVWRFHRDDKAWVRDPKVFMDRGMPMPKGEPPPAEGTQTRPEGGRRDHLAEPT